MQQLSEQEIQRRQQREQLLSLNINPYPSETYEVSHYSAEIKEGFDANPEHYKQVTLAGRLMRHKVQGSASFAEIQDQEGRIQLYFRRDDLCPGEDKSLYNTVFKKVLSLGDFIGVKGYVFKTQVGEISVHVTEFTVLTKSLKPLPLPKTDAEGVVHDAFTDPEKRYRQRYADLVVNPHVRDTFVKRTQLVNSMREFLAYRGYLEVETPILQPLYGGAAARPFKHTTIRWT